MVAASTDDHLARCVQDTLTSDTFRVYTGDDPAGAELGGALKNVIALAAGLTLGAGLGESARAAVITRGFAEIVRFAVAEGASVGTLDLLRDLGIEVLRFEVDPPHGPGSAGVASGGPAMTRRTG